MIPFVDVVYDGDDYEFEISLEPKDPCCFGFKVVYHNGSFLLLQNIESIDISCVPGMEYIENDEELYVNAMDRDVVCEILDTAEEIENVSLFLCGKKYSYTNIPELAEIMRKPVFGYEIKCVDDLKSVDEDIFKIGLFDTVDPRERSLKIMKPKFEGRVHMTLSGYNSLDFLNIDVNKGVALKNIMERYGIKKEEAAAFGDNFNDIEMFDEVGHSYAMLNADEYVRSRARTVIGTNDENSVIKTIKSIIEEIRR